MTHPVFDIQGRTALVTGSSKGVGRALAAGLLEAGATVVLNGRDARRLEMAREELGALGPGSTHVEAFDVTDPAEVAAGVARVEDKVGPLDILVNNAGIQIRGPFVEVSDQVWHTLLDTNLTGAFLVGREVARRMTGRGSGKIVNICSLQSDLARPGIAPYAATKGALKMLTKGMCADLAPYGIQVNGIGPGYFDTELTAGLVADKKFSQWVCDRTPAGRWGRLEDLVGALLFLASPASDFVNGQIIYVDGGMSSVL